MASFRSLSAKDEAAVENLLSQAMDLHVLEQVAAINCAGFTDSVLPTNLETRLRRLKSLPVSRPDPVPSSKKLLSHSKSMAPSSSASAFSGDRKTDSWVRSRRPLVSSAEDHTRIFPGTKRNPSGDDFSGSGRLGSSFTAIGLASSISGQAQEEGSNRKSKSKLSWFGKLTPSRAMGCLRLKTMKSSKSRRRPRMTSNNWRRKAEKLVKKSNDLIRDRFVSWFVFDS